MERGRRTPNILFVDFETSGFINPYRLQPARSIETGTFRVLPPVSPQPPRPPPAPPSYKMTPPRSVSRRDKAAFVIIPEPVQRLPITSDSPVDRVSPFRGKGFKEPTTPRPRRDTSPTSDTDADGKTPRTRSKSRLPVSSPGHKSGRKSASGSPRKEGKSSIPQLVKNGGTTSSSEKQDEETGSIENESSGKPPLPNKQQEGGLPGKALLTAGTPPSKRKLRHRSSVEQIIIMNRATARISKGKENKDGSPTEAALRTPSAKRRNKTPNTLAAPKRNLLRHRNSVEKIIALNRAASPFKPKAKDGEAGIRTPSAKRRIPSGKSPNTLAAPTRKPFEKRSSIEKLIALNRMRRTLNPPKETASPSPSPKRKGSSTSRASIASITRASAAANRGSAATNRGSAANRTSAASNRGSAASKRDSATSNRTSAKSGRTSGVPNRTSAKSNRSPTSSIKRSLASSIALGHMKSLHSSGEDDGSQKGKKSPAGSARSKKGSGSPRGRGGKRTTSPSIANVTRTQMLLTEMSRESEKSVDKGDEAKKAEDKDQKTVTQEETKKEEKTTAEEKKTDVLDATAAATQEIAKKEPAKKPKVYPEPSATLVRTTAAPAIELVKPDIIPEIIASVLPPEPPKESTLAVKDGKGGENKLESGQSVESARSSSSVDTVRAVARVKATMKRKEGAKGSMKGKVQGDADVEVLSANNLMNSNESTSRPGWSQRSPQVTPLTNATQDAKKKTEEAKAGKKCCKCCKTPQCCNKLTNSLTLLCSKLNCCKKSSCCKKSETETSTTPKEPLWRKIFCCCKKKTSEPKKKPLKKEGCFKGCLKRLNCCRCCKKDKKKTREESKCCTKCKSCSRGCCNGCKRGLAKCWRAIFCLNRGCCQKIRDKCCCTKAGCCLPGGCCGRALMPGEERHDPKRQSTKSQHVSRKKDQDVPKLPPVLVDHISVIRAAIPVLPVPLAWFCLFFNIFLPGTGTFWSGLFCLCFGKARFSPKDTTAARLGSFCVNFLVCFCQAFTIIFCLVGWGWSIWWGVMMVEFARKYKRLRQAEQAAPTTSQANIVDAEKGAVKH